MNKNIQKYNIRKAEIEDAEILSLHHVLMFKEIREKENRPIDDETVQKMLFTLKNKIITEMPKGLCYGWIVEDLNRNPVSSGQLSIYSFTPTPEVPDSTIGGYIHSIYTDKNHRGNKLSTLIVNEICSFCKKNKIQRTLLVASNAGRPIYEAAGFSDKTFMTMHMQ